MRCKPFGSLLASIFLSLIFVLPTVAQRDSLPDGYPETLQHDLDQLLRKQKEDPENVDLLVELGHVYFNMGDDLFTDDQKRLAAHEKGKQVAEKALELDDSNPEAHFVYAINLGSAAQIKGITAGALHLDEIFEHVKRTLDLQPDHAPALQMMGGLLAELPWFAGGDEQKAKQYLVDAIRVDGNYTKARLYLAKLYLKDGKTTSAYEQLQAVIQADSPHYPFTWKREYRPQAEELLLSIEKELADGS